MNLYFGPILLLQFLDFLRDISLDEFGIAPVKFFQRL